MWICETSTILATFIWVSVTFTTGGRKSCLSVLENVRRGFSTSGFPTRRQKVLSAPGWICVAFGEHRAAGVCACVCSVKLVLVVLLLRCLCVYVCVFVRLFKCLFACLSIRVSLCFLLGSVLCFSCTLGLGTPFCYPWWKIERVFNTWLDLGAQFGDHWCPFVYIVTALGPDPGFLFQRF